MTTYLSAAVEGAIDEAALRRVVEDIPQVELVRVLGKTGKATLLTRLRNYNAAAEHARWIVLIDQDDDHECGAGYAAELLPEPSEGMHLRIVVRAVEAWFLADRAGLSEFLRVSERQIPADPEALLNPKEAMVNLARRSRSASVKEAMVPRMGSGRSVGPGYAGHMIDFAQNHWNPARSRNVATSLGRCVRRLRTTG